MKKFTIMETRKMKKCDIEKELKKANDELARVQNKLANENFVSRAPEAVVAAERDKADKAKALIENLEETLKALK